MISFDFLQAVTDQNLYISGKPEDLIFPEDAF